MIQVTLIMLHILQFVLLPIMAMAFMLAERHRLPLDNNSPWWWVLLLAIVTGLFTSLTYAFQIGFFEAKHFAPKLFVDRKRTREFLAMVFAPLAWLAAASALGWGRLEDGLREAGVLVLVGHHLVLSLLLLLEVGRALRDEPLEWAAIPVVMWRVAGTGLLLSLCVALVWSWGSSLPVTWAVLFAVSLVVELSGSVPFYRAHVEQIFAADAE